MIKVGAFVPQGTFYPDLPARIHPREQYELDLNVVREIEKLGFHSVWAWDFVFANLQPLAESASPRPTGSSFEPWVLLSSLVNQTTKLRLGHMVLCNTYRHPSLVAPMASTFDAISSGGRLEFGIGAGWSNQYREFGLPFPSIRTRIQMLEEAVQLIKKLWIEDKVNFRGQYYSVENVTIYPKPVQKPHPPVLIGGGCKKIIDIVARHADRFNYFCTVDEYAQKLSLLKDCCTLAGRNFDDIEKTLTADIVIGRDDEEVKRKLEELKPKDVLRRDYNAFSKRRITGTPEQCIETLERFIRLGVTYFVLYFPDAWELESIRLFAKDVKPHLERQKE